MTHRTLPRVRIFWIIIAMVWGWSTVRCLAADTVHIACGERAYGRVETASTQERHGPAWRDLVEAGLGAGPVKNA